MKMNHTEIQPRGQNALRALPVALAALMGAAGAGGQAVPPDNNAAPASDAVVTMDVFEVKTDGDVGYMSQNAAEVTRMNTAVEDIPMNITVFNQQFIDDLVATDTSELIAYDASSVKTSENDDFIARGFSSVGTNFLNGFAQATGFGSQPLTNIERVEVIRGPAAILYGAGAYGATYNRITKRPKERPFTMARTILSTPGLFRVEFDDSAPVPFAGSRKFLYRINGVYEDGETWFGTKKAEKAIAPSLSWQPSSRVKLIAEYFYNYRETQARWETPVLGDNPDGIRTLDGIWHAYGNRRLNWIEEDDFRHQTRRFASADLRLGLLKNLHFRAQFQWETKKQRFEETQAKSDALVMLYDAALLPRYWREYNIDIRGLRSRNELVWEGRTGFLRHRALAGFGWLEEETDTRQIRTYWNNGGLDHVTGPEDYLHGNGVIVDGVWTRASNAAGLYNEYPTVTLADFLADPTLAGFNMNNIMPIVMFDRDRELPVPATPTAPLYTSTYSTDRGGSADWYANDIISLARERIFLSGGLRYSASKRRTINLRTGVTTVDNTAYASVYSFGVVVHLDEGRHFTLYGNMNNSFVPNFNSQPDGTGLEPETGRQKELGLRAKAFGGRLALLATYFDIKQENVTENDPTKPANSGWRRQIPGVRSQGFELSANARLARDWLMLLGYSYTDSRDMTPGPNYEKARPLVPVNRLTLYNRFNGTRGILKGWTAGCGIIFTGSRPLTHVTGRGANLAGNNLPLAGMEQDWGPLPATWRVDASVGYRWKLSGKVRQVEAIFKVKNLFDNNDLFYVATWNRYTVDPGRECQFVFGVRF
jgi:outer membrane receptor protein involved in Fe transport